MNVLRMAASYMNPFQPSYLILFATSVCNAKCGFCFYSNEVKCKTRKELELTSFEFEQISKKCGNIPYLLVSGGEPVLRDDLKEIIGYFINNAHTQYITVPSNGLSPERTEKLFAELTRQYPRCSFRAALSLDFKDQRHDESRGVPGCLNSVIQTAARINELRKSRNNLTLDIVTVYLHGNAEEQPDLRNWVSETINPESHELHLLRPEWPETTVSGINTEHFLSELIQYRKEGTKKESRFLSPLFRGLNTLYIRGLEKVMRGKWLAECTAGNKFSVIDETGNVRLCECRSEILGNLRNNNYSLKQVLKKSRGFTDSVRQSKCQCTWECAVSCNIICNPAFIPSLLKATFSQILISRKAGI